MATDDVITKMLSGNTLQGSTLEVTSAEYYDPDGTILGDGYTGTWTVKNGMGCMNYGESDMCWTLYADGPAAIWFRDGKVDAVSMMIPGNNNNY